MVDRKNIRIDLIKLGGGGRPLRLTEPRSGLAFEKKLDPQKPVAGQNEKLFGVFEAALARVEHSPSTPTPSPTPAKAR
jgi:hypothetical protein